MRHGCYKLCPKVREQLRKAAESSEEIADVGVPSYESIVVAAGPSRVQKLNDPLVRRRSKNGIDYSSSVASSRKKREKRENPSYESVRSRDGERKKHAHWDESDESLQKEERGRGRDGRSQGSSEKRGRARTTLEKRDERRYNDKSPSRTRNRDAEYTSGRETVTKNSGARSKLISNEKIHTNRRSRTEKPEHRAVEQNIRNNVRQQSEGREKKDAEEAGSSRIKGERKRDNSTESSSDGRPYDRHDNCKSACRGINEKMRKMKNAEQQEAFDEYIINKTLSYFEDFCNCHYACLVNQLSKDSFVTSTIASAIIFAIGVKLCSEMDGWRITF